MTQDDWNQAAPFYEASYLNQYRRADALEKRLTARLLGQFPGAKSVLEVGCGTAHFTKWLQTIGYQCVGLDQSRGMLSEAKQLWPGGNLIKGDALHLPISDKSFDITLFNTSLEFIPNPITALSEAARAARHGIILGLLNKKSAAAIKQRLNPKKAPLLSAANYYSLSDMRRILATSIAGSYEITMWKTTVFPRIFSDLESRAFPFGDFLGIGVKLCKS
jgi:ubiquinone/menaquinone biosynthesis C-methylase UbiE